MWTADGEGCGRVGGGRVCGGVLGCLLVCSCVCWLVPRRNNFVSFLGIALEERNLMPKKLETLYLLFCALALVTVILIVLQAT